MTAAEAELVVELAETDTSESIATDVTAIIVNNKNKLTFKLFFICLHCITFMLFVKVKLRCIMGL